MFLSLSERLELILGRPPGKLSPLSGGCVGRVYALTLADSSRLVVKLDGRSQPQLHVEGYMLQYLAEFSMLPVPQVIYSTPDLLIMSYVPGENRFSSAAEVHAAELLSKLHHLTAPAFGLERDTLIGGLHQSNQPSASWLDFFREQRLLQMGRQAMDAARLPPSIMPRLERLAASLHRWLEEPERPALLHGDVWAGNVLAAGERITGFVDPAIYYGHPEIELAFISMFSTFGSAFFHRYNALNPIAPGFFEVRCGIYNLYPLLVHVRLFGGSYVAEVDRTLISLGF